MEPKAYLFDMDHTLINNDCDVSWKEFLINKGIAPETANAQADFFYEQYLRAELDVDAFLRFQLSEFLGRTEQEMEELTQEHFESLVKERVYPQALDLVQKLISSGKRVAMLTATNKTIATPIANHFGISEVLACEVKIVDGKYTNELATNYSCGEGKVSYAKEFCLANDLTMDEIAYYGDSTSDIPILSAVGFPHAVNPATKLLDTAIDNKWPIITFKKS